MPSKEQFVPPYIPPEFSYATPKFCAYPPIFGDFKDKGQPIVLVIGISFTIPVLSTVVSEFTAQDIHQRTFQGSQILSNICHLL